MIETKRETGKSSTRAIKQYQTTVDKTLDIGTAAEISDLRHATVYFADQALTDVETLQIGHTGPLTCYGSQNFGYQHSKEGGALLLKVKPKRGLEITVTGDEEVPGKPALTLDASLTQTQRETLTIKKDPTFLKVIYQDGLEETFNNLPDLRIAYNLD